MNPLGTWDYIGLGIVVLLLLDMLRMRMNRRNRLAERLIREERERIRRDLAGRR